MTWDLAAWPAYRSPPCCAWSWDTVDVNRCCCAAPCKHFGDSSYSYWKGYYAGDFAKFWQHSGCILAVMCGLLHGLKLDCRDILNPELTSCAFCAPVNYPTYFYDWNGGCKSCELCIPWRSKSAQSAYRASLCEGATGFLCNCVGSGNPNKYVSAAEVSLRYDDSSLAAAKCMLPDVCLWLESSSSDVMPAMVC